MHGARNSNKKINHFRRSEKSIDPRPVFFIASEGERTEPDYFGIILAKLYPNIRMVMLGETKNLRGNDPTRLKKRIQGNLREQINKIIQCEAWVVVDKDEWTVEQLNEVANWVKGENHKKKPAFHGMALSNPCFEFWLLLHFKDENGEFDCDKCVSRLKRKYIPNYDKRLNDHNIIKLFSKNNIEYAIRRSEMKNEGLNEDWPRQPGHTTVHILVQHILNAANNISAQNVNKK